MPKRLSKAFKINDNGWATTRKMLAGHANYFNWKTLFAVFNVVFETSTTVVTEKNPFSLSQRLFSKAVGDRCWTICSLLNLQQSMWYMDMTPLHAQVSHIKSLYSIGISALFTYSVNVSSSGALGRLFSFIQLYFVVDIAMMPFQFLCINHTRFKIIPFHY